MCSHEVITQYGSCLDCGADVALTPDRNTPGRIRSSDPETSHRAAESLAMRSGSQRVRVLEALVAAGDQGLIDEEIQTTLRISRSGASTRRKELMEAGYAEEAGRLGVTSFGFDSMAHRATDRGVDWIAESAS